MYNYIINPLTNKKCNIYGKLGKKILNNYVMKGGILEINSTNSTTLVENTFPKGKKYNGFRSLFRGSKNETDLIFILLIYFGLFLENYKNHGNQRGLKDSKCIDSLDNILELETVNINQLFIKLNATVLGSGSFGPAISYKCPTTHNYELLIKIPFPVDIYGKNVDTSQEINNNLFLSTSGSPYITQLKFIITICEKKIIYFENGLKKSIDLTNPYEWWFINEEPTENNKKLQDYILTELHKFSSTNNEYGNYIAISMEKADSNHLKSLNIDTHVENKFSITEKYNDLRQRLSIIYDCPEYIKLYTPCQIDSETDNNSAIKTHIALYVTYILECLLGLWHIHSKGMVHCDIKQDNMVFNSVAINKSLFSKEWNPSIGQVIDFGLSKPSGNWRKHTSECVRISKIVGEIDIQDTDKQTSGQCWGAEFFNPPEYFDIPYWSKSTTTPITSKGDIYSLAICLKDLFSTWKGSITHPNISTSSVKLNESVVEFETICISMLNKKLTERISTDLAITKLWDLLNSIDIDESNKLSTRSFCVKALSLRGILNSNGTYSLKDNKDIFLNDTNFPKIIQDDIEVLLI